MWVVFNKIIWITRRNGIKLIQKCIKLIKHWYKDKIADTKFGVNGHLTANIIIIIGGKWLRVKVKIMWILLNKKIE